MTAGRKINTKSQNWGTPPKYVEAVKQVFKGKIDLDPCSNKYSIVDAKVKYLLPEKDGLKESWNYPTIYVNPPYGKNKENGTSIKNWLIKCLQSHRIYQSEVLALIPVATNTNHWKKTIFGQATAICFLYDTRLKFLENGKNSGNGAPMACAMIYWGNHYQQFYDVFINYGAVIDIRNLINKKIGKEKNDPQKNIFDLIATLQ